MSVLFEARQISGGYLKGVNIVEDINFVIGQQETMGVIGLNGSGKSTLAKMIMNTLPHREGFIFFDGNDVSRVTTHHLVHLGISMMHQGGAVFPHLTVKDNIDIAWGNNSDIQYKRKLGEIIPLMYKLRSGTSPSYFRRTADKLSGGQRLELALVMALACKPRLLILDEPCAGLSPESVGRTYTMLELAKECFGLSIILIEQNISRALSFCDKSIVMKSGRIVHTSSKEEMDKERIESIIFNNTIL